MSLEVRDAAAACLVIKLSQGDVGGFQFKTHPNIDKAMYSGQQTLGLKDPARTCRFLLIIIFYLFWRTEEFRKIVPF